MNRSILLLFFCVFALSEVVLAAELGRIRGSVGVNNSSDVRLVRSADSCVTDDQCDQACKMFGASGGQVSDSVNPKVYCHCDDDPKRPTTAETCVAACDILGVGGGKPWLGNCTCSRCGGKWLLKNCCF
ncbi:hypothetical protein DdX_17321 [Ditylenchus destructor]|uniref:Uncharacterized protein n=1 Tax=Ditylenchus destructor TaxID=166010 RepID=A0AAD4MMZ2_9BILA|nr:hypothetical protein DdX_17321 [Ditylenchus destructor]